MKTIMRTVFILLFSFCVVVSISPKADASSYPSCDSFISNQEHRAYINHAMKYCIQDSSTVQATLDAGKSVIFLFEGGSDNYPSYGYSLPGNGSSVIRNQAVCIVVKKDSNGNNYVAFHNEDCSTIPDYPPDYNGDVVGGAYDTGTLCDGIYNVNTCNHQGKYAALYVTNPTGYYISGPNDNGWYDNFSGINIHTRKSYYTGNIGSGYWWSAGCLLIGYGYNSDNAFNDFMKEIAGINEVTPFQTVNVTIMPVA